MEAEPEAEIRFHVFTEHGTQVLHTISCGLNILISGLKEDVAQIFGIQPAQQRWYHNGIQLLNGQTLWFYGIKTEDQPLTEITVKST